MYQTAQGVVYATPSSGTVSGLPEGYILNLPQSTAIQAVHDPQQTSMYTCTLLDRFRFLSLIYCVVPGSPCLSKTGPVVGPSFSIFSGLLLG